MPVRRLSMIFSLASSVQRWLIFSPSRWRTPSTPSKAASGGRSSVGSQGCQLTLGLVLRARLGSRVRPTTVSPRISSESQREAPMKPLAPVTRTFTGLAGLHGREGAGLVVEAGDPLALGLLDHGFGDLRRDFAVEDAGDDVVLGEVLLVDCHRDALGGGELDLLGDARRAGVEGAAEGAGEGEHVVALVRVIGARGGHDR